MPANEASASGYVVSTAAPTVEGGREFSGIIPRMVVTYVSDTYGPDVLRQVLWQANAGTEDELRDEHAWMSYQRLRSFLETVTKLLGDDPLRQAAVAGQLHDESSADMSQMLQDFGSPANLLRSVLSYDNTFGLSTILRMQGEELAPGEWNLTQQFHDGFEPFREFCAFSLGLHAVLPTLFGLPPGDVEELRCACDGAPECMFRLRWESTADISHQKSYFETRSRILETRLETMQRTVMDLISAPDPEEGLRRVLEAAARSVHAPAYVLAIDRAVPATRRLYFMGVDEPDAVAVAASLFEQPASEAPGRLVVEVASTRCNFGHLAVIEPTSRQFIPQERTLVQSYAGLAAAALDSATALAEARRQATTARTLLDLSNSLTELRSTEEMALNLARAVPSVIDCDRSVVLVHDPSVGELRVVATHGFPESLEHQIATSTLPSYAVSALSGGVAFYDGGEISNLQETHAIVLGDHPVAAASAPMVANDEFIGSLVVLVTEGPARLRENPNLGEALRGLSGQAAVAIRNARLVDQVRHQALHDGLTGLPNRTLVLDRLEQALSRAKREDTATAAVLFIDLDGFKEINDTLGHAAGDHLLVAVADRLKGTLRHSETLGRLGGDEFVVVAEDTSSSVGPQLIAQRILDVLRPPFHLEGFAGANLAVTTSIGIALGHRESAGELLRDADIALYSAKEQGKNCFVVFQPEMSRRMMDRVTSLIGPSG
jgi:diguanylate cyclase (GGDEF)-like protein